jgi:hypothetical protein
MVYPGTLFIGDSGVFLCIPMKIGVKSEHCGKPKVLALVQERSLWRVPAFPIR